MWEKRPGPIRKIILGKWCLYSCGDVELPEKHHIERQLSEW